jgi:hypothetical protein
LASEEMKMKTRFGALILALVFVTAAAFAHGDKKHVSGIVEKITADTITVKSADGKSTEVKLVASTVYIHRVDKEDKPAKLSDVAVGDRVLIHATPKGDTLEADEVKFSNPGAASKVSSNPYL